MRRKQCFFCSEQTRPDYKEVPLLKRFITDRGKILPRLKSGVCAPHQRTLATSIKRARQLALVPFAPHI